MLVPSIDFCHQVRFSLSLLQVLVCILACFGKDLAGGVGTKGGSGGPVF